MSDLLGQAASAIGGALGISMPDLGMNATAYRFDVTVGTFDLGSWTKCDGLEMDFQYAQYVSGMNVEERTLMSPPIWNYRTRVKYKEITLVRPCTTSGMAMVAVWLKQMAHLPTPSMGSIMMYDAGGFLPVYNWQIINVQPSKWVGPTMDIDAGKIATESLSLVHEGWLF